MYNRKRPLTDQRRVVKCSILRTYMLGAVYRSSVDAWPDSVALSIKATAICASPTFPVGEEMVYCCLPAAPDIDGPGFRFHIKSKMVRGRSGDSVENHFLGMYIPSGRLLGGRPLLVTAHHLPHLRRFAALRRYRLSGN